ncbi:MAG TPA: radical SAM protein, partial [Desulfitobacteriaceae bacterium]|nr:radical SAM protein [Desulfitobacteriaceae bacterium]
LVQFSRGCKYSCDFCSIHAFYKDSIRCRDTAAIVEEIKKMPEKHLFFIDDNLFANEEKAKELFKALIPLHKKWFCQISMDAAQDIGMLKLMKQSGCTLVIMGFESLNVDNLKMMKKGANIENIDYHKIISNIYACKLMIYGTFVIGYDFDTLRTIKDTIKFAVDNRFAIANFNPLMPMPGTALYKRLKKENRLLFDKWWLDESYKYGDAMLKLNNLTSMELRNECKKARYEFNSYINIWKRLADRRANAHSLENIILFLAANLISRKEIKAKQGQELGGEV